MPGYAQTGIPKRAYDADRAYGTPELPIPICELPMNSKPSIPRILLLIFLASCIPAWAHHGNAAYDEEHPITVKGTVTEVVWSNPHCQFYVDVKDDKGNVANWAIESQSPGILHRNGWTKDSVKAGDQVTITLAPAKNGASVAFAGGNTGKIVFPDGRVLKMNQR
jgi:hypothetical protein